MRVVLISIFLTIALLYHLLSPPHLLSQTSVSQPEIQIVESPVRIGGTERVPLSLIIHPEFNNDRVTKKSSVYKDPKPPSVQTKQEITSWETSPKDNPPKVPNEY